MYGAESESESDSNSDSDSYRTTTATDAANPEAGNNHRGSFDLFGPSPHRDMPTNPFPVVVDAELIATSEQELSKSKPDASESKAESKSASPFRAFAPPASDTSPQHVSRDATKPKYPLVRSPVIHEDDTADHVLRGLDEALENESENIAETEKFGVSIPNSNTQNIRNPPKTLYQNVPEDGLRIIHNDLRPPTDLDLDLDPRRPHDDLHLGVEPQGGLRLPGSGPERLNPEFVESDIVDEEEEEDDEELNLVLRDGTIIDANHMDEADRELEEIIMVSTALILSTIYCTSLPVSTLFPTSIAYPVNTIYSHFCLMQF